MNLRKNSNIWVELDGIKYPIDELEVDHVVESVYSGAGRSYVCTGEIEIEIVVSEDISLFDMGNSRTNIIFGENESLITEVFYDCAVISVDKYYENNTVVSKVEIVTTRNSQVQHQNIDIEQYNFDEHKEAVDRIIKSRQW